MNESGNLIQAELLQNAIFSLRGHKVMLSPDLAKLYGVEPRALVQAVKRNIDRFPPDFMFTLTRQELLSLKSKMTFSISGDWGGKRALPYAFTEQGVAMLSSVLKSEQAVKVNIEIMRAFVRLREMLASHKDLARKLEALEKKYDSQFAVVFKAIRELMQDSEGKKKKKIGFRC